MRGTESLGGGLNAIFQIENGSVNMTNGRRHLAGRDSFLGLSGGWGTFKMGRFLAPYDDIHGIFGNDSTASTSILSTAALWAQGFAGQPENGGFDDRLQNSIRYDTPIMSRLPRAAGAVRDERRARRRSNSNNQSYFVGYNNGPFISAVGYEFHHNIRGTAIVAAVPTRRSRSPASGSSRSSTSPACTKSWSTKCRTGRHVNDLKRNFWAVSIDDQRRRQRAGLPVLGHGGRRHGQRTEHAGTGLHVDGITTSNISRVAGLAKGDNTGARPWEISYAYDLSKRTRVYTGYVKINNDSNASYTFNINS